MEGYYGNGTDCKKCPHGAYCPGGNRVWPLPGYWNPGENYGFVEECRPQERCLGGRNSSCAIAYSGQFCGSCESDYYLQAL